MTHLAASASRRVTTLGLQSVNEPYFVGCMLAATQVIAFTECAVFKDRSAALLYRLVPCKTEMPSPWATEPYRQPTLVRSMSSASRRCRQNSTSAIKGVFFLHRIFEVCYQQPSSLQSVYPSRCVCVCCRHLVQLAHQALKPRYSSQELRSINLFWRCKKCHLPLGSCSY